MLKLEIVIDIFSGRKNPVIELDGDEAAETLERLKPPRELKKDEEDSSSSVNKASTYQKMVAAVY